MSVRLVDAMMVMRRTGGVYRSFGQVRAWVDCGEKGRNVEALEISLSYRSTLKVRERRSSQIKY